RSSGSATGSNVGSSLDRVRLLPDEETPLESSEALGAALGDEDGLAEGQATRAGVPVEYHAGLQHPPGGGQEGPGEVARSRRVRRAVVAERVTGEVVVARAKARTQDTRATHVIDVPRHRAWFHGRDLV